MLSDSRALNSGNQSNAPKGAVAWAFFHGDQAAVLKVHQNGFYFLALDTAVGDYGVERRVGVFYKELNYAVFPYRCCVIAPVYVDAPGVRVASNANVKRLRRIGELVAVGDHMSPLIAIRLEIDWAFTAGEPIAPAGLVAVLAGVCAVDQKGFGVVVNNHNTGTQLDTEAPEKRRYGSDLARPSISERREASNRVYNNEIKEISLDARPKVFTRDGMVQVNPLVNAKAEIGGRVQFLVLKNAPDALPDHVRGVFLAKIKYPALSGPEAGHTKSSTASRAGYC